MKTVTVLGAGSWGTALAIHLGRLDHDVRLWARDAGLVSDLQVRRANPVYLPDAVLPDRVSPTNSLAEALTGAGLVVAAIPSHGTRSVMRAAAPWLAPGAVLVSATKGLEESTLLRMSEVIAAEAGDSPPGGRAVRAELRGGGCA